MIFRFPDGPGAVAFRDCFGVPVVNTLVCSPHSTRRCGCANAPSSFRGLMFHHSDISCHGNALSHPSAVIAGTRAMASNPDDALFENSIETIGAHAAISFSISADSYVLPSLSVTTTFQPSLTKIFAFAAIISRLSRSTFTVSFSRSAIIL